MATEPSKVLINPLTGQPVLSAEEVKAAQDYIAAKKSGSAEDPPAAPSGPDSDCDETG